MSVHVEIKCPLCDRDHLINPDLKHLREYHVCFSCSIKDANHECECGAKKAGINTHSDWCPRYGLDTKQPKTRMADTNPRRDETLAKIKAKREEQAEKFRKEMEKRLKEIDTDGYDPL